MVGSTGRVTSCGVNGAMESLFSVLQKNVLDRRSWATSEELRIADVTWIKATYHRSSETVPLRTFDHRRMRGHHERASRFHESGVAGQHSLSDPCGFRWLSSRPSRRRDAVSAPT